MIFHLTCEKHKIRLENFKSYPLTLPPWKNLSGGHVTSHDQGLYSNDQGRKRRKTLGTRLASEHEGELKSGEKMASVFHECDVNQLGNKLVLKLVGVKESTRHHKEALA